MKLAAVAYTLASVAVLALMIMRPPAEVSSPAPAATAAPAPQTLPEAPPGQAVIMPSPPASTEQATPPTLSAPPVAEEKKMTL